MKNNDGKKTKKITLIIPDSTEVLDITYYWKTAKGSSVKTATAIMDDRLEDGAELICYSFPEEETCTKDL